MILIKTQKTVFPDIETPVDTAGQKPGTHVI
jgi:hypothetical protein